MKVLIAERDPLVRRTAAQLFEHYGFTTFAAEGTLAGLAIVEAESIDLLFVDLDFDGHEYVSAFVSGGRRIRPGIRVIYTYTMPQPVAFGPLDRYLPKTCSMEELEAALRSMDLLTSGSN